MEARNGDFMTTMKEALQQGPGDAATYTHIECKIGGLERAAMGISALVGWLKDHPHDSAMYVFTNKVDVRTIPKGVELDGEMMSDEQSRGKLFVTTYNNYVRTIRNFRQNQGRFVIVMDMGFGVRTGMMALAATATLHRLQGFLRGEKTGTTFSWLSVSYLDDALLSETRGRLVEGLRLPTFNKPRLCHQDRAHERADGPQRPQHDWQSAAVSRILQEVIKDATPPMVIAFVMSIEDAYMIRNELAAHPQCPPLTMHFIHTWAVGKTAEQAVNSSDELRIVWIDPEVSVVCPIQHLKAIVVAPVLNAFAFDINTTSVVGKKVVCEVTDALASSIRGTGPKGAAVHMVNGFSQPAAAPERRLIGSRDQAELSTASDRDFWHLSLANHFVAGEYAFPGILSVVMPARLPKLKEAERRLDLWHLVDRTDLPPGVDPRAPRPPLPVLDSVAQYAPYELNIHSSVLLAHAARQLPTCVKQVLIDLAMLVSYGPRSVFDNSGKVKGPLEHKEIIQGLGRRVGFAREHCHKGLLWQSLAYLNYFRNLTADGAWGTSDWSASKLDGVVVRDMLTTLIVRCSGWREAIVVPKEDRTQRLSSEEFRLLEDILITAFPFNLMMVHTKKVGYFGRDVTSEVILEEEAQGETVHWEVLKEAANRSRDEFVLAIYSHLWMDTADDDLRVYRAIGVTAISAASLYTGLKYLSIDHFSSLRPGFRPERRCLIPRGTPWSPRQVDSSQDTTSTGDDTE